MSSLGLNCDYRVSERHAIDLHRKKPDPGTFRRLNTSSASIRTSRKVTTTGGTNVLFAMSPRNVTFHLDFLRWHFGGGLPKGVPPSCSERLLSEVLQLAVRPKRTVQAGETYRRRS